MPYFLGAVDEERLLKQAQLDAARRLLRQLERQMRDSEAVDTNTYPRAQALLDEAKQVGLIDERTVAVSYQAILDILGRIASDDRVRDGLVMADGEDVLANLRSQRQGLRNELERVNQEIRSTRTFTMETSGYEREAKEQRARLSSVGLIKAGDSDANRCPVCESALSAPPPTVEQIEHSLAELSEQLEAVEAENPRLQVRLGALLREEETLQEMMRDNQQRIAARVRENEIQRVQQENFILQARTIGKISQYLDTASPGQTSSTLKSTIEAAQNHVAVLEAELDPEAIREKLSAFLNIIGRYMTEYSGALELEHRGSQLRLDIRNLTVVADTIDGPVPLQRMGSGENWVGYHVLAHLALHKWFRQKNRPVPAFIIFDQPSQAHYPSERDGDGPDKDRKAVLQIFELISHAANEIAPNIQIIVTDHADLNRPWFENAVIARWRGGEKLIPQHWIT